MRCASPGPAVELIDSEKTPRLLCRSPRPLGRAVLCKGSTWELRYARLLLSSFRITLI